MKFDFHLPGDSGVHLTNQHAGMLLIGIGIYFCFGNLTTFRSTRITPWLDVETGHRPATGFERFLAVAVCLGFGFYLLSSA